MLATSRESVCVVGLGYVGLPLLLALSKHGTVVGVDNNVKRVSQLQQGIDSNNEVDAGQISGIALYTDIAAVRDCTVFVVTAPTPVGADYRPDLSVLEAAAADVGGVLKKGDMVVFESTVCPGTTDDICIPILERKSSLRVNTDFDCGYSPERISPGDKGLSDAVKVIAAGNSRALRRLAALYAPIIPSGLHTAPSIKVAEAAKITENIQRDVDIAITNELAMLYSRMGIDSTAVLDAAATKWNFRRFSPGLVGGHCIGTDSYYLLEYAQENKYPVRVLQAARETNNSVPIFIADSALALLKACGKAANAVVTIFGFSFKENCADTRSTLVEALRQVLLAAGCRVTVCDPVADAEHALLEYGVDLQTDIQAALTADSDLLIFAVAHQVFGEIPESALVDKLVMDVKGIAARADWRL